MSKRSSPRPSSMGRRRIAGWEEEDVHTGWRRLMCTFQRAGQSAAAKRRTRRRERVEAKCELARSNWQEDADV
jgi:hypothetical protein